MYLAGPLNYPEKLRYCRSFKSALEWLDEFSYYRRALFILFVPEHTKIWVVGTRESDPFKRLMVHDCATSAENYARALAITYTERDVYNIQLEPHGNEQPES